MTIMTVAVSLILTLATHRHFNSINMKALKLILPLTLLSANFVMQSDAAEQKIATVDMRKTYSEYWKTKKAVEGLRQQRLNKEQEVKEMVDERGKKIAEHQKMLKQFQDPSLGAAERGRFKKIMERKVVEIREIEQAVQQFERATNTELTNAQQKIVKTIIEEIRGLVSAKAKEKAAAAILSSDGQTDEDLDDLAGDMKSLGVDSDDEAEGQPAGKKTAKSPKRVVA